MPEDIMLIFQFISVWSRPFLRRPTCMGVWPQDRPLSRAPFYCVRNSPPSAPEQDPAARLHTFAACVGLLISRKTGVYVVTIRKPQHRRGAVSRWNPLKGHFWTKTRCIYCLLLWA